MKTRKDTFNRVLRKGESQRPNGTYMYRWDNQGKRDYIYAKTLNELRIKEKEIQREQLNGVFRNNDRLSDYVWKYLCLKKNSIAISTFENYRNYYNKHFKESSLANLKLKDVRKMDILNYYGELKEVGLKKGSIKIIHRFLYPALQIAYEDGLIFKNYANGCMSMLTEDAEKVYALTVEEQEELINRFSANKKYKRYVVMYQIELELGLRLSELLGLTWDDIDFDKKRISINHQLQYRTIEGKAKFYISKLKTEGSYRDIPMTDTVYQLFRQQQKIWLQTPKDSEFEVDGYSNFVFISNRTGRVIYHTSVRRQLNDVSALPQINVKLPHIKPHMLRHTMCTRMAETGIQLEVLMRAMGHVKMDTLTEVYDHVDYKRLEEALNKADKMRHVLTPKLTPNIV